MTAAAAPTPTATELADDLIHVLFGINPVYATVVGVHDWDGEVPDVSAAAQQAAAARLRELAAAAGAVDRANLDEADRLTLDVVGTVAADDADTLAAGPVEWQLTDLWVAPAAGMLTYLPVTTLPEPAHAAAYLRRLAGLDRFLGAVADRHLAGVAAGRTPVARLVRAAVAQLDGYLGAPERDPFTRPEPPAGWDGVAGFAADLDEVLADRVRPAFARYRDTLASAVQPHGRDDDRAGLCWLPGGEADYDLAVRTHTTTTRTADDLHRAGLELLDRLAAEYAELGSRVFGESDPAAVRQRLRDDPALRCTSAEQMLAELRDAVARAEAAAPAWFARVPEQGCEVRAVLPADEARSVGAYYAPGSLDGARPGTFWQSTYRPTERHRHWLEFTAFHEAVPGHHFQAALVQGQDEWPLLRRIFGFDGHDEGWALYCERLADEMGLYSGDLARFGMLAGDSWRAARLVVDTGLHAHGWSRARAVEFLRANTPLPPADIEVETDRYIADPGQALAYMTGRLEIQRMRADAERRLGPAFDIRSFHDVVLGSGSLPLVTLAEHVDRWARATAGPPGRAAG
jgi:uncharacterized protein (DUF885 family)